MILAFSYQEQKFFFNSNPLDTKKTISLDDRKNETSQMRKEAANSIFIQFQNKKKERLSNL